MLLFHGKNAARLKHNKGYYPSKCLPKISLQCVLVPKRRPKGETSPFRLPDNALALGDEVGKHRDRHWQTARQYVDSGWPKRGADEFVLLGLKPTFRASDSLILPFSFVAKLTIHDRTYILMQALSHQINTKPETADKKRLKSCLLSG